MSEAVAADEIRARLDRVAPAWRSLDPFTFEHIAGAVCEIEALDPTLVPPGAATLAAVEQRSADLRRAADLLESLGERITELLDHFTASPEGACRLTDANRALRLAALSNRRALVDPIWLHPLGRMRARAALRALRPLTERQHELLERLTPVFTDRILFIDVDRDLDASRSASGSTGRIPARRLAAITACTRSGVLGPTERRELALVPLTRAVRRQLRAAERQHAGALGAHYVGGDTMFDLIESSLDLLDEAAALADANGDLGDLTEMLERLLHPAGSRRGVLDRATRIVEGLIDWRDLSARVSSDPTGLWRRNLSDAARVCVCAARSIDRLRAAVAPVALLIDRPSDLGELADIAADIADLRDLTGPAGAGQVLDLISPPVTLGFSP